MNDLVQDVRYAVRGLWKAPGFTVVAVLTLALGIGANTALFSMVSWLLLRPLPVENPAELMELAFQQQHGSVQSQFSVPDYRDIRHQVSSHFSELGGYQISLDGLAVNGKAERVMTYYVTGSFFPMLGLKPAQGRLILPGEGEIANADPVLVLGYPYWQQRFNGNPAVVGSKVTLDGRPFTIVGVGPKDFHGPYPLLEAQAYLPLGMITIEGLPADFMANRASRSLTVLGRLRRGVTLEQARAALVVVGQRLASLYPATDKEFELQVYPEVRSRPQPDPDNTVVLVSSLFLSLAAMVLLLACLNVANILLVRATQRQREMAVRAALGATRLRIVRQLLTESLVLAVLGGSAGILLGLWGTSRLSSLNLQTDLPVNLDFRFDWRVFAYGLGAALLTGVIVGIMPALRASRGQLHAVLSQGSRGAVGGGARLRTALVVAQVGGSLTLLIVAGLFTRSLQAAQHTNLGFDPNHIVNLYMDPSEIGYRTSQTREFYETLLMRVRSMPGVESATTASTAPMGYYNNADDLVIDGYSTPLGQPGPGSLYVVVSSQYLQTFRIPLLRGREFTDADHATAPYVAILNETMAHKYWPNQDPIGRTFKLATDPAHAITVVGVAADARYNGVTGPFRSNFFLPLGQHAALASLQTLEVRARGDAAAMIPEIERVIAGLAPDLPVFDVKTMTQALNTMNGLMVFQIGAGLAAALGVLGLVLSVVGVYGVISYSASQRAREIGIRMALGAQSYDILLMVMRQGSTIVGGGLVVGLACAVASGRLVGSFLVVSPHDPLTYCLVSLLLTLIALGACYVPARRSTRVDPMIALRAD